MTNDHSRNIWEFSRCPRKITELLVSVYLYCTTIYGRIRGIVPRHTTNTTEDTSLPLTTSVNTPFSPHPAEDENCLLTVLIVAGKLVLHPIRVFSSYQKRNVHQTNPNNFTMHRHFSVNTSSSKFFPYCIKKIFFSVLIYLHTTISPPLPNKPTVACKSNKKKYFHR